MKIRRSIALKLCLCLVAASSIAVATTPLALTASPAAVDFQYSAGEPQPLPVDVTVTASNNTSPALTFTLIPPSGAAATLFTLSPVGGQPNTIQVGYNQNTLSELLTSPNIYAASVTVTAAGFPNLTIPLTFSVGGTLSIFATPASLTFNVPAATSQYTQTIQLSGNGGSAIGFSLASTTSGGGSWLSVTTNQSYTSATLTATINPLNVPVGTFSGTIAVTPLAGESANIPIAIPVTLQVSSQTLGASPSSMAFAYTVGGTTPPAQVLQLSSLLSNDTYTAQPSSSGNWLLVNGVTTIISGSVPASLNVTVNPAGLAAGTYQGTITATDADGGVQTVTVTLVVSAISIVANPTSLTFVAQVGGVSPAAQSLAINGTANASFTVTVSGAWISVSSLGGPAPAQLTVAVNPTGLAAGIYSGSVVINVDTHIQEVQVTLEVSANPVLTTNTGGYIFAYAGGSAPPSPQSLIVSVSSGQPQSFTYASGVPPWLQISASNELITPATLTVTLVPQALPNGTYQADIIVTPTLAGGYPLVVPVLLVVSGATAVVPTPSSLSFSAIAGAGPQSKTVEVTAATATSFGATIGSGATNWLSVSPLGGTANIGNLPLTITADAASLAAGTYQGTVTLTTAVGVETQISVVFTVAPNTVPITVSPSSLAFAYTQNGALPAAQSLQVTGSQTFTAVAATTTGGTWLAVTPASGTGNATLSVSVNPAGLVPGTYNGTVTVTPTGGVAQTVAVTLAVSGPASLAATPSTLTFSYAAGNPAPPAQTVSVASTGAPVSFTVIASSSGWLSVTETAATTPATLSVSVNPVNLGAGSYSGSIALGLGSGTSLLNIPVTLTVTAPLPVISRVANAASYATGSVAPGEIITVFGTSLGPTTGVGAVIVNGFIDTTLANVQVTFNGYPGPILYASAGQINTIVPYELAGSSNVSVEAIFGAARSDSMLLQVVPSAPGVFSADASGQGPGAILDLNYNLVSASNPASGGSIIQVFATGQGQTSPGGVDGLIEPVVLPLPSPLLPAGATIGGASASIQYVGAAPGLVAGALQVNIFVPDGLPSGPAALFVSIGGVDSQTGITVAIQ